MIFDIKLGAMIMGQGFTIMGQGAMISGQSANFLGQTVWNNWKEVKVVNCHASVAFDVFISLLQCREKHKM